MVDDRNRNMVEDKPGLGERAQNLGGDMKAKASAVSEDVKAKASALGEDVKARAADLRTSAANLGDDVKDKARELRDTASRELDSSPLVALGAGLAFGALLAAIVPFTRKEKEMLGGVGRKLDTAGTNFAERAKEFGKEKFDELGGDKLREYINRN